VKEMAVNSPEKELKAASMFLLYALYIKQPTRPRVNIPKRGKIYQVNIKYT
jgi:hypothetical protein